MRALSMIRNIIAGLCVFILGGCLVSETPVLDASNGRATPLKQGVYLSCEAGEDEPEGDCVEFSVSYDKTGGYMFLVDDDDPVEIRFRRVGRRGYAVQESDADAGFVFYYALKTSQGLRLIMMQCADLPDRLRARLIQNGDMSSDDDSFETCTVHNLRAVAAAARAYHRGQVDYKEAASVLLTRIGDLPADG